MTTLTAISWPLFIWIFIGLVIVWLLTSRTQIGRTIVIDETPWSLKQWQRLLGIIALTAFILVSPLLHLVGLLVLGGLYHFFVAKLSLTKDHFFGTQGAREGDHITGAVNAGKKLVLICRSITDERPKVSKQSLEKCLFSFPFISQEHPTLRHINGAFELEPNLTNAKYLSSLVDYISHAGFQVEQKN